MTDRLGQTLIAAGYLDDDALDAALEDQVLHGGRLGSNLVELGYLTDAQLAEVLGRHYGLPVVGEDRLAGSDPWLFGDFSRRFAARHQALFLGVEGRMVDVAMVDPGNVTARETMEQLTRRELRLWVIPESLFWRHVEQAYELHRPERVSVDDPKRRRFRRSDPGRPAATLPERESTPPPAHREAFDFESRLDDLPWQWDDDAPSPADLDTSLGQMMRAKDRHQVGTSVLRWAAGKVAVCLVLLTRPREAEGLVGLVPQKSLDEVEALSIPMGRPSVFSTVVDTNRAFHGAPPQTELQARFHEWAGTGVPAEVLVRPVRVEGRIVNLIYLDDGPNRLSPRVVEESGRVVEAMGAAYLRLILERRTEARG